LKLAVGLLLSGCQFQVGLLHPHEHLHARRHQLGDGLQSLVEVRPGLRQAGLGPLEAGFGALEAGFRASLALQDDSDGPLDAHALRVVIRGAVAQGPA